MSLHYGNATAQSCYSNTSPTSTANTNSTASSTLQSRRSLRGMAIKTFGSINIRRKLAALGTVFPHDDKIVVKNITEIYNDVLEFSRTGAYPESVTRAAWKLLVMQIASRKIYHLTQALEQLSLAEMQTFFHTLADNCMTDVEQSYDSLHWKDKGTMLSSSSKKVALLAPVLKFMAQIATQNDLTCQTVLEAGILDIILRIYVIFPTLSDSLPEDVGRKLALMDACQLVVVILCRSLEKPAIVYNHPVCILWTDRNSKRPDSPLQNRCGAWRLAPGSCALRRLVVIFTDSLWASNIDIVTGLEACMDIVEFTRSQFYDTEIINMAFLALLKQIVLSGGTAHHLLNVLAECSYEDTVRVFSGVIHLWLECIGLQIKNDSAARAARQSEPNVYSETFGKSMHVPPVEKLTVKTFYDQAKKDLHDKILDVDIALYNIIQFATKAAELNTTVRSGMLDAGSLVLVLTAFANHNFKLAGLVSMPGKDGKPKGAKPEYRESSDPTASCPFSLPVAAMNAGASTLLVVMRYTAFRDFWGNHRFDTRLSLCSSLVDSLLGRDREQWGSRETRTLFKEIVSR